LTAPRRRILLTGASGLLGGRLATLLAASHDVVAARHRTPPPAGLPLCPLDILSRASLEAALDQVRPDVVVHAAAVAEAERCDRQPAEAERVNVGATEALARLCRGRSLHLVVLSTDMVLAGDSASAAEDVPARPLGVYGRTKLRAEEAALAEAPGAAVLRLALVHGRGFGKRGTASEGVAWALREGRPLRLFTDEYRTPVDAESVADAVTRVAARGAGGRFHIGGPERLSRHALGLRVCAALGLDPAPIEAVPQASAGLLGPRPRDASLDSGRAERELLWRARPLENGIRDGRPERG
jgi:dTDP-4-dehydrorhamnose reductase